MFVFFKPASAESEELFVFPQFFFPLPPSEQRETLLFFQGLRQGLSCVKSNNVHRLPEQEGMLKKKSHPPKKNQRISGGELAGNQQPRTQRITMVTAIRGLHGQVGVGGGGVIGRGRLERLTNRPSL